MARKKIEINPIRGKRLKELLTAENMTQYELSKKIYLSQQTISKIIQGKVNLTERNAEIIAWHFPAYSFDWLMGYDVEAKSYDSPLEFEKDWIRGGGAPHPLTKPWFAEARISIALEKMNSKGWQLAVNLVETLSEMPDLQSIDASKEQER